jgi:hypothetical protein
MSLINPYAWLIFFAVLAALFEFGYSSGKKTEQEVQAINTAKLNAEARIKEQALVNAVHNQTNELIKAQNETKIASKKRNADIDSGTFRLRVPVKDSICSVSTSTDSPSSYGDNPGEARAELNPAFGKALFEIAEEGDRAIAKLNACVEMYNQVRESQK